MPGAKPGSTLRSPGPATWPATGGWSVWSVRTRPGPVKPAVPVPQRMLSPIRATAVSQAVVTAAPGVPTSVTWRAWSVAPQRTRRPGPPVSSSSTVSIRGSPSAASTPPVPRTVAACRTAAPRSSATPSIRTRDAVPASRRSSTTASLSTALGSDSVSPPESTGAVASTPTTVIAALLLSGEAVVTAPSSIRSSSTASVNAWATVARAVQPARSKPTQYVVAASAVPVSTRPASTATGAVHLTRRRLTSDDASGGPARRTSASSPSAASASAARPPPGTTRSGASSSSGTSTKRRLVTCSCGSDSRSERYVSSPSSSRSTSIGRGPWRTPPARRPACARPPCRRRAAPPAPAPSRCGCRR